MVTDTTASDDLSEQLRRDGVVVIEDYLEREKCTELKRKIESRLENGMRTAEEGMHYGDMASAGEPIVNQRSGDRDDGMLDIFNMDLEIPDLQNIKEDKMIQKMVSDAAGEKYLSDNLNIYINRSVTNTRDYHADTYSGKYKAFVYLTDVPDLSYGPFSYVKGSHRPSKLRRRLRSILNRKIRSVPATNAVLYNKWNVKTCTASKGTLIVANQAGLHRGIPQKKGKERMLVSLSYKRQGEAHTG